jgi:hypothetical protein
MSLARLLQISKNLSGMDALREAWKANESALLQYRQGK